MFKKILLGLVAVIAIFLVVAAMQPDDFHVERTATVNAPVNVVFQYVNNLSRWQTWSPWARLDPEAKTTFEGPPAGLGAVLRWAGNHEVGEGSMTIVESRPNELVRYRLDFLKPFKATDTAEFTFKPEGNATVVTWSMYGTKDFLAKAVGLIMNCEKMIGGYFEQGFANLKEQLEPRLP